MALVIETGAGLANSESYASVAELKAYAISIGASIPTAEKDCEVLLRKAMLALRRGDEYIGERFSRDQAHDFPRVCVTVGGFTYPATTIPAMLKEAQMLFAIAANNSDLLPVVEANAKGAIIERTVDVITTKYAPGGYNQTPRVTAAERVLAPLLKSNGNMAKVYRA